MIDKKVRKVLTTKVPLKAFTDLLKNETTAPTESSLIEALYQKFGNFSGEMALKVEAGAVIIKWYFPEIIEKAEFFHKKALSYAKAKDFQKAVASWQEAVNLNPRDPDYFYNLGAGYLEMKKYPEFTEALKKVIELCPIYPRAFLVLGTIYLKLRKFELAEKYTRESLFFQPDLAFTYLNLGIVYSILRNDEKAIATYQRAIELAPQEARAYLGLAKIYSLQGQIEPANTCFHKVIELDQTQQLANYAKRAIVKIPPVDAPNPAQAQIPLKDNATVEEYYAEGYGYYLAGDYLKAEVMYQRYLELKPTDAQVWCALGETQMRGRKIDQAIAAFNKAVTLDKKSLFFKELAIALDINRRPDDCWAAIQQAIKLGKKDSIVCLIGGKCLVEQGKLNEAAQMFEEAVTLNRNNLSARYQLAMAYQQVGEMERAIEHLEEIRTIQIETPLKKLAEKLLNQVMGQPVA